MGDIIGLKDGQHNMGSVQKIEFCDVTLISSIPRMQNQLISDPIVFSAGGSWTEIYFTKETSGLSEQEKTSEQGPHYDILINGLLPKRAQATDGQMVDLHGTEFVVKITDGNGKVKLVGSKDSPLRLQTDRTTQPQPEGRNALTYKFTGKSKTRSPYYTGEDAGASSSSS